MMYIVCIIVLIFLNNSIGIYFKNVCFLNFRIVFELKLWYMIINVLFYIN